MRQHSLAWLWLSVVVIVLDQLTKYWIQKAFMLHEVLPVMPYLNITLAYNTGAAFSFLNQASGWQLWLFAAIAVGVSIVILVWLARLKKGEHWTACGLALILGGALGNLWDRLSLGMVVDFIDFYIGSWHYAAFNLADSAICIGAAMLILATFRHHRT